MEIFWWIRPNSKSTTSAEFIEKAMLDICLDINYFWLNTGPKNFWSTQVFAEFS